MNFDFRNTTVFVSGGTSGINLGIARAFAQAGATLGVLSRDPDKVAAAVNQLKDDGASDAQGWSCDVRDADALRNVFREFAERWGSIQVLVSGAAGNFLAAAKDLSPNGFKSVVDIDLLGTFNVMHAAYPHLRKPGSCLINISAPQSFQAIPHQIHANAAKAGVDQISRTLAREWGPEGIRVNSIVPGPIADTEGMRRLAGLDNVEDETSHPLTQTVPLRRLGRCQDIANLALFLASPLGDYISGTVIPVDGGWSLGDIPMGPPRQPTKARDS